MESFIILLQILQQILIAYQMKLNSLLWSVDLWMTGNSLSNFLFPLSGSATICYLCWLPSVPRTLQASSHFGTITDVVFFSWNTILSLFPTPPNPQLSLRAQIKWCPLREVVLNNPRFFYSFTFLHSTY